LFSCWRGRGVHVAAACCGGGHVDRAGGAASEVDGLAACNRQHASRRYIDAERDALPRAPPCYPGHPPSDRPQSAPPIPPRPRHFAAALPGKAPSFFFIDIPAAQVDRFDSFIAAQAPGAKLERVPMLRGRIIAANNVNADELKPPERSRWVLRGDRGVTYAQSVPPGSRIVEGQWWDASYSGEPLVSMEARSAHDLDLKIGDTITVNVLGRNVTARIANLRAVDWENLGINFVLVFSPGIFDGAPHSDIATLTFADGGTPAKEAAVIMALGAAFPTVSAVRVKDALDAVDALVGKLILALRAASAITLVAAALVLGGALAASQRFRIYDAVVLKTLGATRAQLTTAYALEYSLIGLA